MDSLPALRWCVHPRLRSGELLSWWLHRFAWANAVSNHTLLARLIGGRAVWPRDVDRFMPGDVLRAVAGACAMDEPKLLAATLHRFEGTLFPQLTVGGWLPWITPVGVYHRLYRHHGQAFCPSCLREDRPLALAGRVAFEVGCLRHQHGLYDACPRCDAPITFARVSLARLGRYPCPCCGHNLATALPRPLSGRAMAFEHRCHRVLKEGVGKVGCQVVTAEAFFAGARILVRGLYGRGRLNGLTDTYASRRLRRPTGAIRSLTPFEHWRLTERMHALAALETYLADWPDRFLRDAANARVYRCRFEVNGGVMHPGWIVDGLSRLSPARRTDDLGQPRA
jgi:hypothetical protein